MGPGTRRGRVSNVTLVVPTRADPKQGVDYSAHFNEIIGEDDPRLAEMVAFARRLGAGLVLCPDGFPSSGMACSVSLGILAEIEATEFCRTFSPDMESAIPLL